MAEYYVRRYDSNFEVVLTAARNNVFPLRLAPTSREVLLATGQWVILQFAVWSAPDIKCVEKALHLADRFATIRFGLRPFDSPDETARWLPGLEPARYSPVWILLSNGQLIDTLFGTVTESEVAEHIGRYFQIGDGSPL